MMGEAVAHNLCNEPEAYDPGIWFNSAKFFDLEYQTYGFVPPTQQEGYASFYWEDIKSDKAIRLVHNLDMQIVGINSLGLRLSHEVCEAWIKEGKTLEYALAHLAQIYFDPELDRKFEKDIYASRSI